MSFVNVVSTVPAAVCGTFGALYLGIWARRRANLDYLVFAVAAFGVSGVAALEGFAMEATTPGDIAAYVRWSHVPGFMFIVGLPWFLYLHLRAGRPWLLWTVTGIRTLTLVLNFIFQPNINHIEVKSIRSVSILGDLISVADVVPRKWMLLPQLGLVLAAIFCADVTREVWKRGERRISVLLSATTSIFMVLAIAMAVTILWGMFNWPVTIGVFFTVIVMAMAVELSSELVRNAELAQSLDRRNAELSASEERILLAADAAKIGLWERDVEGGPIWARGKWNEIYGMDPQQIPSYREFMAVIHPDDRDLMQAAVKSAASAPGPHEVQYRIVTGGRTSWLSSRFEVVKDADQRQIVRGVVVDITPQKEVEKAAHALNGKLIEAQENERSRVARSLHDSLSQNLALLSIRISSLASGVGDKDISVLTEQVEELADEVHRLSHALHPATLTRLGLVEALNGFCREFSTARGIDVRFSAENVPRELPEDIALSLYRVAQESLQNVAKHSGSPNADVKLAATDNEVSLSVTDSGSGFDRERVPAGSLGLVSMEERVRLVGGALEVASSPSGTSVRASIPLAATSSRSAKKSYKTVNSDR